MHGKLYFLFADIDNLKVINDRFTHQSGDDALAMSASILTQTFRKADVIGRLGGDEFAVLLNGSNWDGEQSVIERLGKNIEEMNRKASRLYDLSLSLGVVPYDPSSGMSIGDLLSRADVIMYEQKNKKKQGLNDNGRLN